MSLVIEGLQVSYGKHQVIKDLTLPSIKAGELTVLLGPNAAGKSTFFKAIAGLQSSQSNTISVNNVELKAMKNAERLRRVSYMPQNFSVTAALSVFEVILLARKQLQGWRVNREDIEAVDQQLELLGISHLADRTIDELSGGQQQLVSLCQSLIRNAEVLLLDEPTSALDLQRQLQVLHLVREYTQQNNIVTIVAVHDLNLAARFADSVMVMDTGAIKDHGDTETVFKSGVIEETYGVDIELLRCHRGGLVISACLAPY